MSETTWPIKVVLIIERGLLDTSAVLERLRQHEVALLSAVALALAVKEPLHSATFFHRRATPLGKIELYPKLLLVMPSIEDTDRTSLVERLRLARDAMSTELVNLADSEGWTVDRVHTKPYGDDEVVTQTRKRP